MAYALRFGTRQSADLRHCGVADFDLEFGLAPQSPLRMPSSRTLFYPKDCGQTKIIGAFDAYQIPCFVAGHLRLDRLS